jgi:hypothetical protein
VLNLSIKFNAFHIGVCDAELIEAYSKHTSEQMRDLVARGVYWWQQPEFIEAHSKQTTEQMRDLVAQDVHWFQ